MAPLGLGFRVASGDIDRPGGRPASREVHEGLGFRGLGEKAEGLSLITWRLRGT